MAVNLSPSATGTPTPGAPAAGGLDAAASQSAELVNVDDALMADLLGDAETPAGDEDPASNPDPLDCDDAASTEDGEEATDEDDAAESDANSEDEDATPDDTEADPADPKAEAPKGTPAAVRKALQDAKVPHGLLKRIDKAFEHSRTYREEAERLRQDLANAPEPVTLAPSAAHPLSDVQTPDALDDRRQAAEFWLDWCADNPDGGTLGTGAQTRELTAEETNTQRRWASNILKALPARQQYLAQRQHARSTAQQALPEMFRKDTPEYRAAQALVAGTPELVNQPDYEMSLADMVRGLKYRVMESKGYTIALVPPSKKKAPDAAAPPAGKAPLKARPVNPPLSKPTPTPTGGKPDMDHLSRKASSGSEKDVDALLMAELA
jgi:hypothetical protein